MHFYPSPETGTSSAWRRGVAAGAVAALHVVALLVAFGLAVRPDLAKPLQALTVRMLERAPAPPVVEPPRPQAHPPAPRPVPVRRAPVTPPPVLAAAPVADAAPASFTAPPPAEVRPAESAPAPAAPASPPAPAVSAPLVAARFDADYLQNPKPVYPPMSRRLGEEGKVVLRVRVSAQGQALSVEVRQSSGFTRLDDAARSAVERWRFVPARQGEQAVEAWVLVPLTFTLDN